MPFFLCMGPSFVLVCRMLKFLSYFVCTTSLPKVINSTNFLYGRLGQDFDQSSILEKSEKHLKFIGFLLELSFGILSTFRNTSVE